jgi:hypothetical protein
MVGNYFTHDPSMSPACNLWNLIVMGGLEQTSLANTIFLSIAEAKACWRAILTRCLKNWMQKDKNKWFSDYLPWKRWAHSLMKWSISCLGVSCTSMAIRIKWCPSWNSLYLQILAMALSYIATPTSRLMTLKAIVFRIRSITTPSTTKTWSFWVI